MSFAFSYTGEGHVTCGGTPPLELHVGATVYPCADVAAEWCRFEPAWELGLERVVCVNDAGPSEPLLVEVPEPGFVFSVVVGLLVLIALARWRE